MLKIYRWAAIVNKSFIPKKEAISPLTFTDAFESGDCFFRMKDEAEAVAVQWQGRFGGRKPQVVRMEIGGQRVGI